MDRRKRLATVGAVSMTASAAIVALASGVGLFGLTQDSPRVGKLSPIDSTHSVQSTSDTANGTTETTGNPIETAVPSTGHAGSDDPVNHDADDDRVTSSSTTNTVPHANDAHGDDDSRSPESSSTEADHDDD
jgi:hypothetical protein